MFQILYSFKNLYSCKQTKSRVIELESKEMKLWKVHNEHILSMNAFGGEIHKTYSVLCSSNRQLTYSPKHYIMSIKKLHK